MSDSSNTIPEKATGRQPRNIAALIAAIDAGVWGQMTGAKAKTFGVLVGRANGYSGEGWTGMTKLAKDAGISLREAKAAVRWLVEAGLITREMRAGRASATTALQVIQPVSHSTPGGVEGNTGTSEQGNTPPVSRGTPKLCRELFNEQCKELKTPASAVVIPDGLNTPEFTAAWGEWQEHRKQIKNRLTPLAAKKQLKLLEDMGPARAVAAIDHSIRNGWRGIFEQKESATNGKRTEYRDGVDLRAVTVGDDGLAPDRQPYPDEIREFCHEAGDSTKGS